MLKLLLATRDKNSLAALASSLDESDGIEYEWAESGERALEMISQTPVDLLVVDEELGDMSGLELARRLIFVNPMVGCAAVSSLAPGEFEKASDGLGLLPQLPPAPGKEEAGKLIQTLKEIKNLLPT